VNPNTHNKNRLKEAVNSVPVPEGLESRLRSQIHTKALGSGVHPPSRWLPRLVTVIAAAGFVAVLSVAYHFGHFRLTRASQDAYITSAASQIDALMRIGLRDHIHCSVFRKYPKNPPTAEEILNPRSERGVKPISTRFAGLIPIVRSLVPEKYRMTLAHQCTFKGREYIHLSLKDESSVLSLVITRKVNGESFRAEDMLPALNESGIPMYQAGVQRFQIAAFETSGYLVYFISDLGKQQNSDLMLALAPPVKGLLTKLDP